MTHVAMQAQIVRAIGRRAVAFSALQQGLSKDDAAARAGVTRNCLNRYLRDDWKPA